LPIHVQHFDINQQTSFFQDPNADFEFFFINLLETRLSEAAGHLQSACKDVKWRIMSVKSLASELVRESILAPSRGLNALGCGHFLPFFKTKTSFNWLYDMLH
jgi:hypothetical protein